MNAVPRSVIKNQRPRPKRQAKGSRLNSSQVAGKSTKTRMLPLNSAEKVAKLNPSSQLVPIWLRSLIFCKRSSDCVTLLLVGATLAVYSWTVYSQQQWAKEYQKLESLQRDERHITKTNEVLKDQLAQQAESPATGMVVPSPAQTIFLPRLEENQVQNTPKHEAKPEPAARIPLGY
ncbi:MAG: hypothetical protein WA919_23335 [Coleofasciculaceae cyanobacterium]